MHPGPAGFGDRVPFLRCHRKPPFLSIAARRSCRSRLCCSWSASNCASALRPIDSSTVARGRAGGHGARSALPPAPKLFPAGLQLLARGSASPRSPSGLQALEHPGHRFQTGATHPAFRPATLGGQRGGDVAKGAAVCRKLADVGHRLLLGVDLAEVTVDNLNPRAGAPTCSPWASLCWRAAECALQ